MRPAAIHRAITARGIAMATAEDADAARLAHERDLATHHEARGPRDMLHGAIHGKHSSEQMNSWEIAKIDLSNERRIALEIVKDLRAGEPPAIESTHGQTIPVPPRRSSDPIDIGD